MTLTFDQAWDLFEQISNGSVTEVKPEVYEELKRHYLSFEGTSASDLDNLPLKSFAHDFFSFAHDYAMGQL